jgi:alpha-glucosidase
MKEKMIFTINEKTHPSKEMNTFIRDEQLHFVPLLDVGISIGDTVGIKTGENLDIFLKHPKNADQTYSGEVWPGIVFFVDFLHPNAT